MNILLELIETEIDELVCDIYTLEEFYEKAFEQYVDGLSEEK